MTGYIHYYNDHFLINVYNFSMTFCYEYLLGTYRVMQKYIKNISEKLIS
jgi:hypothetical protein